MSNYLRKNFIEKDIINQNEINKYYSEYHQKNNNYIPYIKKNELKDENSFNNVDYNENNIDNNKYIYLKDPYTIDINYQNEKNKLYSNNIYNNNSVRNNYNKNFLIHKKGKKNYKKINIKNYYFFNTNKDEIFDEYIIDYKSGFNNNENRKKTKLSMYNSLSLQNWRKNKKINKPNTFYNKLSYNNEKNRSTINSNNSQILNLNNNEVNKNKTYEYFYHINNSKEKRDKYNIDAPYKKRILNDYNNHDFKVQSNNILNKTFKNSKFRKKILQRNNTSENNINKKKLIKDYYNYIYLLNDKNEINNHKKHSYILSKISSYSDISFNKTIEFANHLSKYCSIYYSKIIKQLFSFLKQNKNKIKSKESKYLYKDNININFSKRPISSLIPRIKPSKFIYRDIVKKNKNKIKEKKYINISSEILIDRIRSKNQSLSPNSRDKCEMFRNINELSKKYETISNRKNKNNNTSSIKKMKNNISFNSENKSLNEFRFSSIEKNKEKWEMTINKERERKKKNIEEKEKKNNKKENNISKLTEVNRVLKNKIEKFQKKGKKTLEINWNLDAINLKSKEKNNLKDFSFGDKDVEKNKIKYFYEKVKLIPITKNKFNNKKNFKNKIEEKNEMINIKNIISKDKRIYINMNYLNYKAISNKEINKEKFKLYQECNVFNIRLLGNKNNSNYNNEKISRITEDENTKYFNMLTSIKEEDNKLGFSENVSQSSTENAFK